MLKKRQRNQELANKAMRAWRQTPKGKANSENKRTKIRVKVESFKLEKGCINCGLKHPAVLQLHHRNQHDKKKRGISQLGTRTLNYINKELEKCDVLCANCHLIRHYNEKSGYFAQKVRALKHDH